MAPKSPKLRTSCDACGNAKVKCDKQHPRCGRCSTYGLRCVYGVSQKHGKPYRKKLDYEPRGSLDQQMQPQMQSSASPQCSASPAMLSTQGYYSEIQTSFDIPLPDFSSSSMDVSPLFDTSAGSPTPLAEQLGSLDSYFPQLAQVDSSTSDSSSVHSYTTPSDSSILSAGTTPLDWGSPFGSFSELPYTYGANHPTEPITKPIPSAVQDPPIHVQYRPATCSRGLSGQTECFAEVTKILNVLHALSTTTHQTQPNLQAPIKAFSSLALSEATPTTQNSSFDDILSILQQSVTSLTPVLDCTCMQQNDLIMLFASSLTILLDHHRMAAAFSESYHTHRTPPNCPQAMYARVNPSASPYVAFDNSQGYTLSPNTFSNQQGFQGNPKFTDTKDYWPLRRLLLVNNLKKVARTIATMEQTRKRVKDKKREDFAITLTSWLKGELGRTVLYIEGRKAD